jgi:hypothetical protein
MGSAILASIGSTRKSNVALMNMETAKTISTTGFQLSQADVLATNR